MLPTRPISWNLDALWIFYVLAAVALGYFSWGLYRRSRIWLATDPQRRLRLDARRVSAMIRGGLLGTNIFRGDLPAGVMHILIAWGFFGLFVGTTLLSIHEYLFHFLVGTTYLVYSVAMEVCGLALLTGLLWAALRRWITPVRRLRTARPVFELLPLLWLAAIGLTGFFVEGARLAAQEPTWGEWSFVGALLATIPMNEAVEIVLYRSLWWIHALLALGLIAWIPRGKLLHTVAAPLNLLARQPEPRQLSDELGDEERPPLHGAHRLSLDACTHCGRCSEVCPSTAAEEPLAPRELVQGLRTTPGIAGTNEPGGGSGFAQAIVTAPPGMWHCTSCRACQVACPVGVSPIDLVAEMRGAVIEAGQAVPPKLTEVLERLYKYGNPWLSKKGQKAKWAKGLDLVDLSKKKAPPTEWAWFVGCTTSLDTRAQGIARALAEVLSRADVTFGTLGKKEPCCGDIARRVGEAGLFEEQRDDTMALIQKRGLQKILVTSPHCFDTLASATDPVEAGPEVVHVTQLLAQLVDDERLPFGSTTTTRKVTVTFHDPCYLARHRGIVDEPRRVLSALPGVEVVEMKQWGVDALCCGGGGGRMWQDLPDAGDLAGRRVRQAVDTGAELLVTACPLCLIMLEDARKTTGLEDSIEVIDLTELTLEALTEDSRNRDE